MFAGVPMDLAMVCLLNYTYALWFFVECIVFLTMRCRGSVPSQLCGSLVGTHSVPNGTLCSATCSLVKINQRSSRPTSICGLLAHMLSQGINIYHFIFHSLVCAHTCPLSHTRALALSRSHSLPLFPALFLSRSLSLSRTLSITLSHSL